MNRQVWMDYLKAFGIVAVVVGHADLPLHLTMWIYSFHMPLFFFLTGALLTDSHYSLSLSQFAGRRLKKLIHAYLVFALVGFLWTLLISQVGTVKEDIVDVIVTALSSILYGSGTTEGSLQIFPVVLWFFTALIVGVSICYTVKKCSRLLQWPLVALVTMLGFLYSDKVWPWEIESGLSAACFIFFGSEFGNRIVAIHKERGMAVLGAVCVVVGGGLGLINGVVYGGFDLRSSYFGNPFLSYPSCLITIVGFCMIASRLPSLPLIKRLSLASILIFPIHPILFRAIDIVALSRFPAYTETYTYEALKCVVVIVFLAVTFPFAIRLLGLGESSRPRVVVT